MHNILDRIGYNIEYGDAHPYGRVGILTEYLMDCIGFPVSMSGFTTNKVECRTFSIGDYKHGFLLSFSHYYSWLQIQEEVWSSKPNVYSFPGQLVVILIFEVLKAEDQVWCQAQKVYFLAMHVQKGVHFVRS